MSWFDQLQQAAQKAKEASTRIQGSLDGALEQASSLGKALVDDNVSFSDVLNKKNADAGSSDGALTFDFEFLDGPLGFQIAYDENGPYVASVEANGQAAGHGVNIGDRLVAVAGTKLSSGSSSKSQLTDKQLAQTSRPITLTFAFAEHSQTAENDNSAVEVPESATKPDESALPAEEDDGWEDLKIDDDALVVSSEKEQEEQNDSQNAGTNEQEEQRNVQNLGTCDASGGTANIPNESSDCATSEKEMKLTERLASMGSEIMEANARAEAAERSLLEEGSELVSLRENAQQQLHGVKSKAREILERERQLKEDAQAELAAAQGNAEHVAKELEAISDAKSQVQATLDKERQQSESLHVELTAARSESKEWATELHTAKSELASASSSADLMSKQLAVFEALRTESEASENGAISHDALQEAREQQGQLEMESLRASEANAREEAASLQVQLSQAEDRWRLQMATQNQAESELESLRVSKENSAEEAAALQVELSKAEDRCRSQMATESKAESDVESWKALESRAAQEAAEKVAALQQQLSQVDDLSHLRAEEADARVQTLENDLKDILAKHECLQRDCESEKEQLARVQTSFASSETQANEIREDRTHLVSEHAASKEEVHMLSARIDELKTEMQSSQEELSRTRTNLESLLQANQDDGQLHHQQLVDVRAKLEQCLADKSALQVEHDQAKVRHEGASKEAAKECKTLENKLAQSLSEISAERLESQRLQNIAAHRHEELSDLKNRAEELRGELGQSSRELEESQQSLQKTQEVNGRELRKLRAEASATSTDASQRQTELDSTRQELHVAQNRLKIVHGEMEQSRSEHQELLNAGALRDDRVNAAQSLLASKIQGLEDQLRNGNQERESIQLRLAELDQQRKSAEEEVERVTSEATLKEVEHQATIEVFKHREQELQATISRLQDASRDAELRAEEAAKGVAEAQAKAQLSITQHAEEAQAAISRASASDAQSITAKSDLETAQAEAQRCLKEAESHKQLVRSLQNRLAEQEKEHSLQLEAKRAELEQLVLEGKLREQGKAEVSTENDAVDPSEGQSESSAGAQLLQKPEPTQKASQEETSALHARIESLEKQCASLRNKLNARPIIYKTPTSELASNPLRLEAGPQAAASASSTVAAGRQTMYSLVWDVVDQSLRKFTERLLKRDAFLWVFYIHLLVLYMISGSSLYGGMGMSSSPDCMEITMNQSIPLQPKGK